MSDEEIKVPKRISYSALTKWQLCPHYYKLDVVLKLKTFDETVWKYWGTLIHKYSQSVLQDHMEPKEASDKFARTWNRFCDLYGNIEYETNKKIKDLKSLTSIGAITVLTIKDAFKQEFGNFKVLGVERRISTSPLNPWPQNFKGFVDIIIQLENDSIVIIDLKSCSSSYYFNKCRDKYKDYQLTLYKHFLCLTEDSWDQKTTETYFVTLERNPASKNPIGFTRVTAGQKKIDNALKWLDNALYSINNKKWIKNRSGCHKYGPKYPCHFFKSKYCK